MAHGKVVVVVEVMNIVSAKPSHRLSNIYRARLMRLQFDGGWRVVVDLELVGLLRRLYF